MKLIFLYGPPGVGKLTVAKELVKITGYDLFHNHLTVDLAASIFPFGTQEYSDLVERLRLDLLHAASSSKKDGLIFTFVYGVETYGGRTDDLFVQKVVDIIQRNKGEVLFIKLTCSEQELHKRLRHPSRKEFRKLRSVQALRKMRKDYDLDATIPFDDSFVINNTKKSATEVAESIKTHYRL